MENGKPDRGKTAYIFGPMRGYKRFNFDAFDTAQAVLEGVFNYHVISPANLDREIGFDPDDPPTGSELDTFIVNAIMRDLQAIALRADFLVGIAGWRGSDGSQVEIALGRLLWKPIYELRTDGLYEVPESSSQEAERLVRGARQKDYGHPRDDFGRTATLWDGILGHKMKDGEHVTSDDVPLMMVCLKLSRLVANPHHRDSVTDGHGYFNTYDMLIEDTNEANHDEATQR